MQDLKNVKLSFADDMKTVTRRKNKTIVRLVSYFTLERVADAIGVDSYVVWNQYRDIFEKFGYKSEMINGKPVLATVTRGVVELQDGDVDDQAVANRIANTKAKVKAYTRFGKMLLKIYDMFYLSEKNIMHSIETVAGILEAEEEALDRCMKTGYCDPKKG